MYLLTLFKSNTFSILLNRSQTTLMISAQMVKGVFFKFHETLPMHMNPNADFRSCGHSPARSVHAVLWPLRAGAAELSRSSRTAREVRHISLWPLTKKGCWARHQGWAGYEGTRVGGCWICMLVGKKRECLGEWTPGGREHWEGREGHRTRRALGWAAEAKSICILARVCSGVGESPQTDEAT